MKKWHKWVGLFFTFFLFMFALSGIFLNHRKAISSIDIPRSILGSRYNFDNWNRGAIKGGVSISPDSILLYGANGIWLADSLQTQIIPFTKGIKAGADNNIINNILKTPSGDLFAISTFDLYKLDIIKNEWECLSTKIDSDERFVDIAVQGDSVVLMTRSDLYIGLPPYTSFRKTELPAPIGYQKEASLFRTMWTLHSGELFYLPGKILVDIMGVFTIILCITGLILLFFPKIIKRGKKSAKDTTRNRSLLKGSLMWHNKIGVWFLAFFLIITVTGMFLRPPLLISIVRSKTKPIPGSMLDSNNAWHDKLRSLVYDNYDKEWIIYSSDGFFQTKSLELNPQRIKKAPPVSVMGVNVLHQQDSANWIVGSFSGLYLWDKHTGRSIDLYTNRPYEASRSRIPIASNSVSGYCDLFRGKILIFEYDKGIRILGRDQQFVEMPDSFKKSRMSLWHVSLEVHVGRIYAFLPGLISDLFIFISGVLFLIILISGYIIYLRFHKKKKKKKEANIATD